MKSSNSSSERASRTASGEIVLRVVGIVDVLALFREGLIREKEMRRKMLEGCRGGDR